MQVIKNISARELFKLHPEIRKQYFWGGKLWTQSYFVETIGNANEDVIRAYVQNQLKAMNENEAHGQQLRAHHSALRDLLVRRQHRRSEIRLARLAPIPVSPKKKFRKKSPALTLFFEKQCSLCTP